MYKKLIFIIYFMIGCLSAVDDSNKLEAPKVESNFFKGENLHKFSNTLKEVVDYTKKLECAVSKNQNIQEALELHNQTYSLPEVLCNITTITKNALFEKGKVFEANLDLKSSIEKLEKELNTKKDAFSKTMGNIFIKAQNSSVTERGKYFGTENYNKSGFLLLENEKYLNDYRIIPLIKKFLSDFNQSSKLIQQVLAFLDLANKVKIKDIEKDLSEYDKKMVLADREECLSTEEQKIFSSIWTLFHSSEDEGAKFTPLYDSLISLIINKKLQKIDTLDVYHDYVELKLKALGVDTNYLTRYKLLVNDFINERKKTINDKNESENTALKSNQIHPKKLNDIRGSIIEINGEPFYFYKKNSDNLSKNIKREKIDKLEELYQEFNNLMNLINGTNVTKKLKEIKNIDGINYVIFNVDPSGLCGWEALGINPEEDKLLVEEIVNKVKSSNTYGEIMVTQFGGNIENAIKSIKSGMASNPTASVGRFLDHPKTWEILPEKLNINIIKYIQNETTKKYTKNEYTAGINNPNVYIHAANGHFDLILQEQDYNQDKIPLAYALTELEYVRKLINEKLSKTFVKISPHFDSMKKLLDSCKELKKEMQNEN